MNARKLLLKLRLCHGIGPRGEHRVYLRIRHYLNQNIRINVSVSEIIRIARISSRCKMTFLRDYFSRDLQNRIRLNERERWLCILDSEYPIRLREANYPPNILFYRGRLNLLATRCLGVVGARKNSQYSVDAIRKILPPVIKKKVTIVAGLAEGVDSLGHQCAIANRGNTIAVIGTGLDQIYPRYHRDLQNYIGKHQLLLTEYPLGSRPLGFHFPARNRIIAGLIETIVIIEARERSGSLITANLALDDNRNVTAVPGSIISPLSNGCNGLIMKGAKPIRCAKDLLREFRHLTK